MNKETDYSPLLYAAKLPKSAVNKDINKVLDAENKELEAIIAKAEANAAITNKKPCTTPSCNISWRSFFLRKYAKPKTGGRKSKKYHKRSNKRRNKRSKKRR
jgi:hypothetical protein